MRSLVVESVLGSAQSGEPCGQVPRFGWLLLSALSVMLPTPRRQRQLIELWRHFEGANLGANIDSPPPLHLMAAETADGLT